ncbi:hypothetical protein ACWKTS_36275 [Bacillus toyonensis]|uniref:hypothetical protein n=1 Tax=Bacillus cereus group TaxID=86661 RepID=UPI000BF15B89|nr:MULTISPECIES: hypothetical protein [Bacillus cereus group]PEL21387.1 hypothetical protein CN624_26085 [Bacillus toyonensis]PEO59820.1 hypothetical protein CN579_17635 [Bacillus toyonensis]PEV72629.1 hypothetical protein CN429_28795 [Bacillus cereus]PFD63994.1 hypothetical protein CN271_26265 [Bacillus cereus]PHG16582.1 hypothetical protein COI63_01080 [Bacillus toyonensis]
MNAAIEELEQSLHVMNRKLREHKSELERLIEKKPIVENNIKNTETKILDIKASIFVLKKMAKE